MAKNRVPGVLAALAVLSTLRLALPPDLRSQACPDAGTIKPQATVQEAIKQISGDLTGLCAAVPSAPVVVAAPNAVPKATSGGTLDPSWTKHARVVVVDSAGGGDFTTLSAALTYVAAQSPVVTAQWLIQVLQGVPGPGPGGSDPSNYAESGNLTVPIYTVVQGVAFGAGAGAVGFSTSPTLKLTCPTGTCLKLPGGTTLVNLNIQYKGAPTATVTVLGADNTGSGSTQSINLVNVGIQVSPTNSTFVVDGLTETAGAVYLQNSGVQLIGGNAGNRAIVTNDTTAGRGISIYGGRFTGATGCSQLMVNAAASGGGIQLFNVRIDQKCTTDLVNTGTGTFNVYATPFFSSSGTIAVYGPTFIQYGTSNPATCSPGQQFTNTTTPAHCDCVATNTWKCITIL